MTEESTAVPSERLHPLTERWHSLNRHLEAMITAAPPQKELEELEGAVIHAFPPVEPSLRFREHLRSNLSVAAEGRVSGLIIEYPRPYREGIILGVSAGALLALVTGLILWWRSRTQRA